MNITSEHRGARRATLAIGLAAGMSLVGPAPAADATRDDIVERQASPLVNGGITPGLVIGILKDGERSYHGLGRFSADDARTPDGRTLFEIGSITKVFTALLMVDAEVRGELSIDDPLSGHLPEGVAAPTWRPETDGAGDDATAKAVEPVEAKLWHLASHQSGLPRLPANLGADSIDDPYAAYGEAELWDAIDGLELLTEPGVTYAYSNLAPGLLGAIVARGAGTDYAGLIADRITRPLGMPDTVITLDDDRAARFAPPHTAGGAPSTNWHFKALAGAGALRSTAADLLTFAEAVMDEDHPMAATFDRMEAVRGPATPPTSIALGWHVAGDGRTLLHGGGTNGYRTALYINEPSGIAVVALSNATDDQVNVVCEKVLQSLLGMDVEPVEVETVVELGAAAMERLAGVYVNPMVGRYELSVEGGRLMAKLGPQPAFEVFPESSTEFFYRVVEARLTFDVPADGGAATAVTLQQGGQELRFERVVE